MSSCYTDIIESDNINYSLLVGPHESSSRIDKNAEFEVCSIDFSCGITVPQIYNDIFVGISSVVEELEVLDQFCAPIGQPKHTPNDIFCENGGLGLTHFSSQVEDDIGLDLEPDTQMVDAFQLIDNWLKVYLMTTPPAPCFRSRVSCETDEANPDYFYVEWDNIPRRCLGFLNLEVPLINEIKIDYVKSEFNTNCDFTHPSVTTVSTGSTTVERFQAFTDTPSGASSGMFGTTIWREFTVEPGVTYDIRVYGVNYNCDHSLKYMVEKELCTLLIGPPSEPLNLTCGSEDIEEITLNWDKPLDNNIDFPGNDTTPLLEEYSIDYIGISTIRSGGLVAPATSTVTVNTGDTLTTEVVSNLNPGTMYEFQVSAKNVINDDGGPNLDGFGAESNTIRCLTLVPDDPDELDTITLANSSLRYSGGACTLDAGTFYANVYNWNLLDPTNTDTSKQIRTNTLDSLKNNFKPGTESLMTSTIKFYTGLSTTYITNCASTDLNGFTQPTSIGNFGSDAIPISQLVITEDQDHYSTPTDFQGFWKEWGGRGVSYDIGVTSEDTSSVFYANFEREYKMVMVQDYLDETETTTLGITTNTLTFVIDDINVVPGITSCGLTDVGVSGVVIVSGVPTFTTDTTFNFQFTETEIAHKFIRPDKCHAFYGLYLSDDTLVSDLDTIAQSDIGVSHKYYVAPGVTTGQNYFETSTTLHNTNGLVLAEDPGDIQFNDFEIGFDDTLAENVCDDDVRIRIQGCNLFGVGTETECPFLDVTTGVTKKIRIDTCSTSCLYDTDGIGITTYNDLGLLVQSSLDTNTALNPQSLIEHGVLTSTEGDNLVGDVYDHNANLVTDSDYVQTLQLYQGRWQNPVPLDFDDFYMPSGVIVPDYSGVIEDGEYRYVTFKYKRTPAQFDLVGADPAVTRERVRLTIVDPQGLTVDFTQFNAANHRMQLKVDGYGSSPGDGDPDGYDTYWLDCTNVTQSVGIINGIVSQNNPLVSPFHDGDNVGCINGGTSTVQQRDCFIPVVTNHTATFYVRIGWPNDVDYSIGCGVYLEIITGTFAQNPTNPFL